MTDDVGGAFAPEPRPPPYTCETFGVRWEDVKFTAKEEDSDDEGCEPSEEVQENSDVPERQSREEASTEAGSQSPSSQSEEERPEANAETTDPAVQTDDLADDLPGRNGQKVSDDDESVEVCENLWDDIRKQMENIIAWSLMCVVDGVQQRKRSFELFGYDFMIGDGVNDRPDVWLIEVNSSPACDYSTPVTCPLVKQMMEDLAKVVVDLKEDASAPTGEWQLLQHSFSKPVPGRMGFASNSQLEVLGKKMKVPFKAKKKKRKSSKKSVEGASKESDEGEARRGWLPTTAHSWPQVQTKRMMIGSHDLEAGSRVRLKQLGDS
eukprot:Skav219350  [mRNA]  locus=scaffold76:415695:427935:- [translate_table: standard]